MPSASATATNLPLTAGADNNLGTAYYQSGRLAEARQRLEQVSDALAAADGLERHLPTLETRAMQALAASNSSAG